MQVKANNTKVPFSGTLTIKFYNPMFNDITGHSLPISFDPRIPSVNKAFGFPAKKEAQILEEVSGSIDSQYLNLTGSWGVNEASRKKIEAYFKSSSGDFYSHIKDKYLTDVDFGGDKYPGGEVGNNYKFMEALVAHFEASYPTDEFAVYCAYLENAAIGDLPDVHKFVNPIIYDGSWTPGLYLSDTAGNYGMYLFVGTVLDYLFDEIGYRIESNIFRTDPDLQRLTIFNTYNVLPANVSAQSKINYQKLVPKITCSDFLKSLRRFNIGVFINEESKSVVIKKFDSIIEAGPATSIDRCMIRDNMNTRVKGVNFPLNAPDAFSQHTHRDASEFGTPIVVASFQDILPATRAEGDVIFVTAEQTYYRISDVLAAVRLCANQFPYYEGDESAELIESLSGIPAMYSYTKEVGYYYPPEAPEYILADVSYMVPRCDLAGNREGVQETAFPLMFVFAWGLQKCKVEGLTGAPELYYPMGTVDIYDACGDAITGANIALRWGGSNGLIETFWTNRLNWEQNIRKTVKAEILEKDIRKLIDFTRIVRIGNDNYLVNWFEIETDYKDTRLEEVELLRL